MRGTIGTAAVAGHVTAMALGATAWLAWLLAVPDEHAVVVLAVVAAVLFVLSCIAGLAVRLATRDLPPVTDGVVTIELPRQRMPAEGYSRALV